MAVVDYIGSSLGYYEMGKEARYEVPTDALSDPNSDDGDYFEQFRDLLSVDTGFMGETDVEFPNTQRMRTVRFRLRSDTRGLVFSTLLEVPDNIYSMHPNIAYNVIDEAAEPLRAQKHHFRRRKEVWNEGPSNPFTIDEYTFVQRLLKNHLALRESAK